jgi:cobalt/nickel transport protein
MERGLEMVNVSKRFIFTASVIVLLIAVIISPFASESPDGLEKVAEDMGFLNMAKGIWRYSPFSDYSTGGIENKYISTGLTGIIGVIIVFVITLLLAKIIKTKACLKDSKTQRK